jgi:uncharacterized small protein (DUF1192 family)
MNSNHSKNINNGNNLFTPLAPAAVAPTSGANNTNLASNNGSNDSRIWGYVRSLEERVNGLQEEVVRLRSQVAAKGGSSAANGA